MLKRRSLLMAGLIAVLTPLVAQSSEPADGPAYQIVLRSRHAEVTPSRSRDAQTGGGSIEIEQPDPNTIVVTMGGSAVAGSDCHGANAGMDFNLQQDLDIIAVRPGVRPPRVGMVGRVVGTLQVTESGTWCGKSCGTSEQGPAAASLAIGANNILHVSVQPSSAAGGQEVSINHREGPVEAAAVVGSYHLAASFRIGVTQGKGVFNRQAALADFDPAPQLDGFWADVLKPFRAVPRRDFGFKLVLRVAEDRAPEAGNK
jgi:hypothetical protein